MMTRIAILRWVSSRHPEGEVLPLWLVGCHAILFPKRTLIALLQSDCALDPFSMTWKIHGVRFSDRLFMAMAQPRPGVVYRFERVPGSDIVTVTELPGEVE